MPAALREGPVVAGDPLREGGAQHAVSYHVGDLLRRQAVVQPHTAKHLKMGREMCIACVCLCVEEDRVT